MNGNLQRKIQGLLLVLLGLALARMIKDLTIIYFIHSRFIPLTIAAVLMLFWLAKTLVFPEKKEKNKEPLKDEGTEENQISTHPGNVHLHEHHNGYAQYLFVLLPVFMALLPAKPLQPENAFNRELVITSSNSGSQNSAAFTIPPEQRSLMDWFTMIDSAEDTSVFTGQPVQLTGTILLTDELPEERFFLSRMLITCCVADAVPVGILVDSGELPIPPQGTWVRLEGNMSFVERSGSIQPLVQATAIFPTDPPDFPYITQ